MTKNKLLTIIFSILLGVSIFTFLITFIVGVTSKVTKHGVTKISCEITDKVNNYSNVTLKYKIKNDTTTDISSLKISTMVCVGKVYSGNFETSYNIGIDKKSERTFTVSISSDFKVYNDLRSNNLSELNFKHYLTYVSFSDFVTKDNICELIGSTFNN